MLREQSVGGGEPDRREVKGVEEAKRRFEIAARWAGESGGGHKGGG